MKLEDVEKIEVAADELEHLSDKAFTKGTRNSKILGLEKNRIQADHLRSVAQELRDRIEI